MEKVGSLSTPSGTQGAPVSSKITGTGISTATGPGGTGGGAQKEGGIAKIPYKKDLFPNRFYKKIWFYLFIFGFALSLLAVLVYLYTDILTNTNVYVISGAGVAIVIFGAIISFFSFREPEATLKTFKGEDTEITLGEVLGMSEDELRQTFSRVTGVPLQYIPS